MAERDRKSKPGGVSGEKRYLYCVRRGIWSRG